MELKLKNKKILKKNPKEETTILRPKEVERRAVEAVIRFEKKRGWLAKDMKDDHGCGYDVYSENMRNKKDFRCIEVKGRIGNVSNTLNLYIKLKEKLGKKIKKYFIYLVRNVETSNPRVQFIEPEIIFKKLKIKKSFILKSKDYKKHLKN